MIRRVAALMLFGASTLAGQAPPRLLLHHLSFALDSATYHDVVTSPFLREQFAGWIDPASASDGLRCTGSCLIGRHTFLEITSAATSGAAKRGGVGLVLASEQVGGLAALMQRFTAQRISFDTASWSGRDGQGTFPALLAWRAAGADSLDGPLSLAVVEYTLAAATRARLLDSLEESDRGRSRYLAPYLVRDQLFAELTAATFAVPVEEIAKVSHTLQQLGVEVLAEGQGAVILVPGFSLRLLPASGPVGVRKLEFSLNREALANPTYRFGASSRLRFGPGRVATWEF